MTTTTCVCVFRGGHEVTRWQEQQHEGRHHYHYHHHHRKVLINFFFFFFFFFLSNMSPSCFCPCCFFSFLFTVAAAVCLPPFVCCVCAHLTNCAMERDEKKRKEMNSSRRFHPFIEPRLTRRNAMRRDASSSARAASPSSCSCSCNE